MGLTSLIYSAHGLTFPFVKWVVWSIDCPSLFKALWDILAVGGQVPIYTPRHREKESELGALINENWKYLEPADSKSN